MNIGRESETLEHKRSIGELREGMESLASILNKHGHGTLTFGVADDGTVVGQEIGHDTVRKVSQAVGNMIEPKVYPDFSTPETPDGKSYIKVEFSGFEAPYSCDGVFRIRRADEDVAMSHAVLDEMLRARASRAVPWDKRSSGLGVEAVDESTLEACVARGVENKRIPFAFTTATDVLRRLDLLCEDGTLTNAAAVLFTPSPRVMLRMGVFADSDRVKILDNRQCRGTLFSLADEAEAYILNNTRRAFVIDGTSLHRKEVPEVPQAAAREAIFNALAHRQYEDSAAVQVDIFWDRVDVYSPGLFPLGYDPADYLEGDETTSKPRNELIASTLYRFGDIETYGTGLRRIANACREAGVPFEVRHSKHGVHVTFARSEAVAAGVAPVGTGVGDSTDWREEAVLSRVRENGSITTAEAAELLLMKDYTARRYLNGLVERGILAKSGTRRLRVFSIPE